MKKMIALLLALVLGMLPTLALGEDWITDALDAGRSVSTTIRVEGIDEIEGFDLVLKAQEGSSELMIGKAGRTLLKTRQGVDGGEVYFSASPLGEKVYKFGEGDLITLAKNIVNLMWKMDAISENDYHSVMAILNDLTLERLSEVLSGFLTGATSTASDADYSALLKAVIELTDNVVNKDVEDYVPDSARFGSFDTKGHAIPALKAVCSESVVTLTKDDMVTIIDALSKFIEDNQSLANQTIDEEELKESMDELKEIFTDGTVGDVTVTLGMDAEDAPVFAALTFNVNDDEVHTCTVECVFAGDDAAGATYAAINGTYGGLCFMNGFLLDDASIFTSTLMLGDMADEHVDLFADVNKTAAAGNRMMWDAAFEIRSNISGNAFDYALTAECVKEKTGVDAARSLTFSVLDSGAAIVKLIVDQASGEPLPPVDFSRAVYPAKLDENELMGLIIEIVMNAMNWYESVGGYFDF